MDATMTALKPECLAWAGAIPCRGCGACGRNPGDRVPDVPRSERARVARDHFNSLRGRQYATGGGGDANTAALKRHWNLNPVSGHGVALQDEFGGDEAAFVAFRTHELAGHVTICGGKRHKVTPLAAPSLAAGVGGLDAEWADPATQREFGGDKAAFVAFRTHELAGDVTICGGKRRAS